MTNSKLSPTAQQLLSTGWSVSKVSLYDEEGVEGWRWESPSGETFDVVGDWDEEPPFPPGTKIKFTPAPWVAEWNGHDDQYEVESKDSRIGCIYGDNLADANLIATAPEMYAYIDRLLTALRNGDWTENEVADGYLLLDKARGEVQS